MVDEIANIQARPDVTAALAETAFASLARAGAPVVVAEGDPARVIHANRAALALFAVADCEGLTHRLFGSDDAAARRLSHLAQYILPGAAARLERISLRFDGLPETVTILCRRTPGADPLFVLAGLGMRAGLSRAQPSSANPPPKAVLAEVPAAAPASPRPRPVAASAKTLAVVKADLDKRFPGVAQARFLWRTDAANVVTEITPPLAEIVGPGCARLIGRDFGEAVAALGLDPRGELARALAGRATFSRVDLDWPIENAAVAAPVTLGALPAFDRARGFEGWRGFGVIHLDALREAPAQEFSDSEDISDSPDLADSVTASPVAAPSPALPAAPSPALPAAPAQQDYSGDYSGVVVPLRPLAPRPAQPPEPPPAEVRTIDAPQAEATSQGGPDSEADSVLVTLSPHERNAFREIARTLGARGGESAGALEAPEPVETQAPEPKPGATSVEPQPSVSDFLPAFADALPVGLVLTRGGKTFFANRRLLDWLGFETLAAFLAAGGLRAACKGAPELAPSERRALSLRPVTGDAFEVEASRGSALWEGEPADCLTLTRPSTLALEQRVGVLETGLRQREAEADETLAILDIAADGFVLLNGDGVILGLNRPAEKLLGYGRDQIAGESFSQLFARETQAAALEAFARLKSGERPGARDVTARTRQGAAIPLTVTLGRLGKSDDKASPGKYCAVLRDMSQWKAAESALEEARGQAQRDSQAKSEFLAKVSHEIRTPLNAILGFAEVIMDERFGPVGNERYKEYLRDIHTSGNHVMSLVNDLLDLSKIEAGKMDLALADVDANRVVAECVALIQPQANRERVITRLALAPRLPAIVADERSLRQIVLNLLANAVRYNEPGGQVIVSTALSDSGHAVLRVKDTGVGMSEADLRKAMEPFGQASSGRVSGGTGLGLPLTKALVDANHAGLAIRSRKNEGTLVEVTFPLASSATEVLPAAGKTG